MKASSVSLSSAVLSLALALAALTVVGCSKDKKDDGDAAADAAAEAAAEAPVADAAAAVADVDASVDASAAPLSTLPIAPTVATRVAPKPDPPICANARAARKRNSPAAPGLESQCRQAGGTP